MSLGIIVVPPFSVVNRLTLIFICSSKTKKAPATAMLLSGSSALTGWVARMESQRRSEKTKAGLARIKAQGRILGRPKGSKDKNKGKRRVILSRL